MGTDCCKYFYPSSVDLFITLVQPTPLVDLLLNSGVSFCGRGGWLELQHRPGSDQHHKDDFPESDSSVFADSGSSSSSEEERPKRSNVKNGEVGRRRRHSHSRSPSPSPRKRQKESSPR